MAIVKPVLNEDVLNYDTLQTDEINKIDKAINLLGTVYYFNNPTEEGLARPFPIDGNPANVYRSLTMGNQGASNQFEITDGGYSIRYIGDGPATFLLACGGGLRLTGNGWTRLQATLNGNTLLPNSYFTRNDGDYIDCNLNIAVKMNSGDTLRIQLTGLAGTITNITSTWFQLTRLWIKWN